MWIPYAMISHALAEKHCGAKRLPWSQQIIGEIERNGCGSGTDMHDETTLALDRIMAADLRTLAADGDPRLKLTAAEVEAWAASTATQFGGCSKLVEWHERKAD